MNNNTQIDKIVEETVAQLNTIDGTERRHALEVIKSACERGYALGYGAGRLSISVEQDCDSHRNSKGKLVCFDPLCTMDHSKQ